MKTQKRTGCSMMRILTVSPDEQQPCSGEQNALEEQLQKEMILWSLNFGIIHSLTSFWQFLRQRSWKMVLFLHDTVRVPFIIHLLKGKEFSLLTIWDATMAKIFVWLRSSVQCTFTVLGWVAKRFFFQLTFSSPQNRKGKMIWGMVVELMFFDFTFKGAAGMYRRMSAKGELWQSRICWENLCLKKFCLE